MFLAHTQLGLLGLIDVFGAHPIRANRANWCHSAVRTCTQLGLLALIDATIMRRGRVTEGARHSELQLGLINPK